MALRQDKERGVQLLQQSAGQGFVPPHLSLAYSYEFGDGVPADAVKAMGAVRSGGEGGLLRAQLIAADHYSAVSAWR